MLWSDDLNPVGTGAGRIDEETLTHGQRNGRERAARLTEGSVGGRRCERNDL